MIEIDPNKNKIKSIAIAFLVLAAIFGIGYLVGYYGSDLIKNL